MAKNIVHVASGVTAALSEPAFLIEHEGRLYLTAAVLEYDPKAPNATDEQKRGVEHVRKLFEEASAKTPSRATVVRDRRQWAAQNTGPVPIGPGPAPGAAKL